MKQKEDVMQSLLKLNHWQIFILIYGIPLLTLCIPFKTLASPSFKIVSVGVYIYYMVMMFSWPLSIGIQLSKQLPQELSLSKRNFLLHFVYICFCACIISISNWLHHEWMTQYIILYAFFLCYFLFAAFIVVRFASKVFASVELGREAKVSEYAGYMFAIWFSFMGVWFVQPKIRRLMNPIPGMA
jgi:hypothetical protein